MPVHTLEGMSWRPSGKLIRRVTLQRRPRRRRRLRRRRQHPRHERAPTPAVTCFGTPHGRSDSRGDAMVSRLVSGILLHLSPKREELVTIPLCGLPESCRPEGRRTGRPCSLLGLAPSGVCRAVRVAPHAGALLPHRCTLTCDRRTGPSAVSLCCTVRQVAPTWLSPALCPVESRLSSTRCRAGHDPRRGHPADSPSDGSVRQRQPSQLR